jgi:hemerythrin-like domain-containing protein
MKASEDLRNEHELIKVALNILEKLSSKIRQNENVEIHDLKEMVDFLIVFSDKCHHGKEELYYFPALEKAGIPNESGPIGVMLSEHEQGRSNIRQMKESVSGESADMQAFAKAASLYVTLMRNHIEKENGILFMMGDQRLPEEMQKELLEKFGQHEKKVVGEGKHEELHALLEKFEQKYLSK